MKAKVLVKKKGTGLSDAEVKAILRAARASAVSYQEGGLVEDRIKALQFYRGDKFGNEMKGRSQVVSRDVLDTIETLMPELMEVFIANDVVVKFEPQNQGDEEMADQATDYCNYVFTKQNEGFMLLYTWIKDALNQKNGLVKVLWENTTKKKTQRLRGLSIMEVVMLVNDDEVHIEEQKVYRVQINPMTGEESELEVTEEDEEMMDEQAVMELRYDLKICYYNDEGKNALYNIPPEEFIISPRARNIISPECCAHESEKTASELIETYPHLKKIIDTLGGWSSNEYGSEKTVRYQDEAYTSSTMSTDLSTRKILTTEWYIYMDVDGDGIAELRRIVTAGENIDEILENEDDVDENPFVDICPYPEPHKFHGMSVAELVMDIQLIKSTIMRQLLDNMYQVNNQRYEVVTHNVDMDAMLDSKPNGIVGVKVAGSINPITTQSLSGDGMGMLDKLDQVREQRTGVYRNSRGLDLDRLHDTALGMEKLMDKLDKRTMLIARIFAEMGMKRLFKKILNNMIKYQDKEVTIPLNDGWVTMDPRTWRADMNVTVHVGLGTGNKDETIIRIKDMMAVQAQAYQSNPASVTPQNMWTSLRDYVKAQGKKTPEMYFTSPDSPNYKPPQPQPSEKIQIEQMKLQQQENEFQRNLQLEYRKAGLEYDLGKKKLSVDLMTKKPDTGFRPGGQLDK